MSEINKIEKLFNVEITCVGHRTYDYSGDKFTVESVQKVIDANPGVLAWQDADSPDCGMNNGVLYLVMTLPVPEEELGPNDETHYDTLFCFGSKDNDFSIV